RAENTRHPLGEPRFRSSLLVFRPPLVVARWKAVCVFRPPVKQRADFDLSALARFALGSQTHVTGSSWRLQSRILARWSNAGIQPWFARSHVYLYHAYCR